MARRTHIGALWLGLSGCGPAESPDTAAPDTDEPATETGSPAPIPTWSGGVGALLRTECQPCHTGYDFGDLSVQEPADFVGVPSSIGMAQVTPGDPSESYVWHKVSDTHRGVGGAGERMPLDLAPLGVDALSLLETWIRDGAPD